VPESKDKQALTNAFTKVWRGPINRYAFIAPSNDIRGGAGERQILKT
jgi:hypothetical protein